MPSERMTVRRLNSLPLADTGTDISSCAAVAPSPYGSPRAQNTRLPSLWKSFKAKLGSLGNSRSATSLSALPLTIPASLCESPHAQSVESGRGSAGRGAHCGSSQRLFPQQERMDSALPPKSAMAPAAAKSKHCARNLSISSSPISIVNAANALSPGTGRSFGSVTTSSLDTASPLPRALSPVSAMPSVSSIQENPNRGNGVVAEAAATVNRRLLAVSSALPESMRRNVWALEDYVVSKRLFKGSSSAVYKATCRWSGMPVALKVYFLERVPPNIVHMLKREIEIHSQLVHKHVVRLYSAFLDEGDRVVLVQEYASRGDLYGVLQRVGGRMGPNQVAEAVMRPFLDALSYLHSKGICHRDIKPENLLFSQSWRFLVADFGVSINLNQERAVTRAGTEGYMAPEVERCPLKAEPEDNKDDPRYSYSTAADIWAAGALAYELMVGFPPVVMPANTPHGTAADAISGFMQSQMTTAALHFPASVPPAARAFVLAALSADPLERPTAAQLLKHPWLQPEPVLPAPEAVETVSVVRNELTSKLQRDTTSDLSEQLKHSANNNSGASSALCTAA